MTLSPLVNAPIIRQDTLIEVVRKGDGSQAQDEVFVTTSLQLATDLATEEVTLLLPLSGQLGQQPLLRYTGDDVTESTTFDPVDRSAYDQAVADALAETQAAERAANQKMADAIAQAAGGFSQAVLKVRPGQRDLRFFYTVAAPRAAEGSFELSVLGPLASFVIQPGGSISVVAVLPRGTSVQEAVALQNPTDPGTALPQETTTMLGSRPCIGWVWQNDPLFRIRYTY